MKKVVSFLMGWTAPCSLASMCHNVVVGERHNRAEPSAMQVITIGPRPRQALVSGSRFDAAGKIVLKQRFRRLEVVDFFRDQEPCLVGMEACAKAHHWARELIALGHEVRLMPPAYVKAYVKRNKNDAADAAAICEAVTRPSMRFVSVKNVDQQGILMG
jgi:transposase